MIITNGLVKQVNILCGVAISIISSANLLMYFKIILNNLKRICFIHR